MNLQFEIIYRCATVSEGMAAMFGITCIWRRTWLFACACVYAMFALKKLFRGWGIR